MAKRALRKKEEIEAVPLDQAVLIDTLDDDPVLVIEPDDDKPEPKINGAALADGGDADLKKQLADLKKAEEAASAQHQRDLEASQRRVRELEEQNTQHRTGEVEAQLDSVLNAINAAEAESQRAETDLQNAASIGDYKAQADAQKRLSRAEARLESLESGKSSLEAQVDAAKKAPARTESITDPFEANIASLPDAAKVWLRGHREFMIEPRKNAKIQAAHWDVLDEGHAAYSPAYFESLEVKVGLKQAPKTDDDDEPETRSRTVSAPVTRDTPSLSTGKPLSNKVTLTPEEREVARSSGIDEREYARQKLKLQQLKRDGMYNERG